MYLFADICEGYIAICHAICHAVELFYFVFF